MLLAVPAQGVDDEWRVQDEKERDENENANANFERSQEMEGGWNIRGALKNRYTLI